MVLCYCNIEIIKKAFSTLITGVIQEGSWSHLRFLKRLRDENDELHLQVSKLAALVDHYFAAWQEASSALQRRERELAELRRSVKPRLVALRK